VLTDIEYLAAVDRANVPAGIRDQARLRRNQVADKPPAVARREGLPAVSQPLSLLNSGALVASSWHKYKELP
jgi:hypothetical protein